MWTRILSSFVMVLGLFINAPAMSAQSADEAAVTQAVEALRKAVLAKDKSQFEPLLAEQLVYGHSDGRTDTKASYINDAVISKTQWKRVDYKDQTVRVTGDIAIVRHIFNADSEREGKMVLTNVGAMTVWQKQGGQWKLLARQAYTIK